MNDCRAHAGMPASATIGPAPHSPGPTEAAGVVPRPVPGVMSHSGAPDSRSAASPHAFSQHNALAMLHADLVADRRPVGPVEEDLVWQLARAMVSLREYEAARDMAIQAGRPTLAKLFAGMPGMPRGDGGVGGGDLAAVAAMTGPAVRSCEMMISECGGRIRGLTRQLEREQTRRSAGELAGRAHELGMTLDAEVMGPIAAPEAESARAPADGRRVLTWMPAETESDCEQLFRAWRRTARLPCPRCASRAPPLELAGRRTLQCRSCELHYGLRADTLLAHSKVQFLEFVRVVRLLVPDPATPVEPLGWVTGLSRKTIRKLVPRVQEALRDPARRDDILIACGGVWSHA